MVLRSLLLALLFFLSACGDSAGDSELKTTDDPIYGYCPSIRAAINDPNIPNKGWGTTTITHPDILSYFSFRFMMGKIKQVANEDDQQEMLRRIIRSFLVDTVKGADRKQPTRTFAIPELLCPLMSESQKSSASFCTSSFSPTNLAAIKDAISFLDRRERLGNYAAADKMLEPLVMITRPQRFDLEPNEQLIEFRVVYGLRDVTGLQRKPMTIILEFKGPTEELFYRNMGWLFHLTKDKNSKEERLKWARSFGNNLDCNGPLRTCLTTRSQIINQIRVNEVAFRENDILWDLREYRFPNESSPISDFAQVPVAFTPFMDFNEADKDPVLMNADFDIFLKAKGLSAADLSPEQSVDFLEEFMAKKKATVSNSGELKTFIEGNLQILKNSGSFKGSKKFGFHTNPKWAAGSALARPGMRFFDTDSGWSKTMMETCQGCHVQNSSIARAEKIDTTQTFYHVSPRLKAMGNERGPAFAGSNLLSPFLLRETELRMKSYAKLASCL